MYSYHGQKKAPRSNLLFAGPGSRRGHLRSARAMPMPAGMPRLRPRAPPKARERGLLPLCCCAAMLSPYPTPAPRGVRVRATRQACARTAHCMHGRSAASGARHAGVRSLLDRCCCLRFSTRISLLSSQSQPSSERWNGGLVQLSCSMRWPHASWPVTGLGAFGPFYLVPCGGVSWVGLGLGSDKSAVR